VSRGEQLKMFMTAHEITQQYSPNYADRLFHGTDISVARASGVRLPGGPDPRAGEWTGRDVRTDAVPNRFMPDPRGKYHPQRPIGVDLKGPWAEPETDEQFWGRKRAESQRAITKSGMPTTTRRGGKSLESSIKAEGVKTPIALGHQQGAQVHRRRPSPHRRDAAPQP
jgi:hypothetical protein